MCRVCTNKSLYKFLELGRQPPANAFLTEKQFKHERFFPLDVYFCPECGLVQLLDIVSPDLLFRDYAYFTSKSSQTMKRHFAELARVLIEDFHLAEDDLVVDIGSNDGTLLKNFQTRVLGVDPAENVVKQAIQNGVETICDYFGVNTAFSILNQYGEAKVIIGTNVLAHVNNLYDFMAGVSLLLDNRGVFVVEVPHFLELYRHREFDTIYHEHLSYFLTRPISRLAESFGMTLNTVKRIPVHGGSIRSYMTKWKLVKSIGEPILNEEWDSLLYHWQTYSAFAGEVNLIKDTLVNLLTQLRARGKRITGYGAPAKGNTLLNYCKIGPELLEYLSDTTPFKQGKFSPGMHIPVVSPDVFHEDPPDYALMLPWNYKDEILRKEQKFMKDGGKFIVPIPKPEVVP